MTARAPPSPTPEEIRAWRRARELSSRQAGGLVYTDGRTWRRWEAGENAMSPALWELVQLKGKGGVLPEGVSYQGLLSAVVDAWEALPGGRHQPIASVERWLIEDMAPVINRLRKQLGREKPR